MSTTLFDTLRVTKDLQSCGFDSKQSEGIVAALETSLDSAVATKADVTAVGNDISAVGNDISAVRTEIAHLRTELKADIQTQANKIIVVAIAVAAVAIGAMKLL